MIDKGSRLPKQTGKTQEELRKDILQYFLRNPQAADTLGGVVQWRLLEQQLHYTIGEVGEALDYLVKEGFLEENFRVGNKSIYCLKQKKKKT